MSTFAVSNIIFVRSSNMTEPLLQCAAQQLAELGRKVRKLMNHDCVLNDRAQAVIHDADSNELDAGLLDLSSHVLGVQDCCFIARFATCSTVGEDEHDLAGFRPWNQTVGADVHRFAQRGEAGTVDGGQPPQRRLNRLVKPLDYGVRPGASRRRGAAPSLGDNEVGFFCKSLR